MEIKDIDMTAMFFDYAKKMMQTSRVNEDRTITPDNVYQEAYKVNRDKLLEVMKISHLPGSGIEGVENIFKLYELAKSGKSCIILSEHLSNLDVPNLFTRFYDYGNGELKEIFEKFIFIAGAKLNENPVVKIFTEMFTRVVIIPPRTTKKWENDHEKFKEQIDVAKRINLRSARKIMELKNKGNIFVMYPAGTRYRPWDPSTKKGMKETMAYMSYFDYFCCCAIDGNNMAPKEHEDMAREQVIKEKIVFNFGEVVDAKKFMGSVVAENNLEHQDKDTVKQYMVDKIMTDIENLHSKY